MSASRRRFTPTGRYLTLFASLGTLGQMLWSRLRRGPTAHFGVALGTADDLQDLADMLTAGTLKAIVAQTLPMREGVRAHQLAANNHGGIVLLPAG